MILASLYQVPVGSSPSSRSGRSPVDRFEPVVSQRRLDYRGRSLVDHLLRMLPEALTDDGTACVMQLSIIGERRTTQLLERLGYQARVVDFGMLEFTELFEDARDQIARVEELSDA